MSRRHRELLLSAAFALWGLTIAIALITVFRKVAPPDQAMGYAKTHGFDARGPLRWMVSLILLPIGLPFVFRAVIRRLADGEAWARHAVLAAPVVMLWLVTIRQSVTLAIVPFAVIVLICTLHRARPMEFTRHDVVLLPVFLTTLLAFADFAPATTIFDLVPWAALLVFGLRLATGFLPSPLAPAFAFAAAPLALTLQTGFFARDQRHAGWPVIAIVVITPFLLRVFLRNRRRVRNALAFVVYPLALFCYWNAISRMTAEGKPRSNFFENGHSLLPASEYLRGERPYRDILPAHGLIEDGLFDALIFQTGDVTAGRTLKARDVVGTLMAFALYALAFAATGSAEGALLAVFLSMCLGAFTPTIRVLPAIATLALIAGAVRWRRPGWFGYAALLVVVCGATSLDYGFYTFVTLVVALWRAKGFGLRYGIAGLISGLVVLGLGLGIAGAAGDFVRGTFVEIPRVSPAYTLNFFAAPVEMQQHRFFPEVVADILRVWPSSYLMWPVLVVFTAAMMTSRQSRRVEPVVLAAFWAALTGISYAERNHLYFTMIFAPLLIAAIMRMHRRHRGVAVVLIGAAIVLATPTTHLSVVGINRTQRGPGEGWAEINDVARARGAYWPAADVLAIASVKKYFALSLKPDETFFDFTNSGAFYFLFNRDCPIREYEVAFFQSDEGQREVIRRLEANPKVRAALMSATPMGRFVVDIPNAQRAPLVQQYLEANFEPDFEEGEIVFWRRK